jgi:AmmeMemoRadiSam system protein B
LEGQRAEGLAGAGSLSTEPATPRGVPGAGTKQTARNWKKQIDSFFYVERRTGLQTVRACGKRSKASAPTYDLKQAGPIYAWAYKGTSRFGAAGSFVIIGTPLGLDHVFAVTDKDFETPLGPSPLDQPILNQLKAKLPAFFEEDLCHQAEQAVEFQLPFLQEVVGSKKPFTIVPILSSFSAASLRDPTVRQSVDQFLTGLREVLAQSDRAYCVIAAGELAHLGMRYGDKRLDGLLLSSLHAVDLEMLKPVEERQPEVFANYIRKEQDQRRISGFSPIYSLLRLIEAESGQVLRYDRGITDQYNSTVTYASMAFF